MMKQMQRDSLTGLYNKIFTQEYVRELLEREPEGLFAFLYWILIILKKSTIVWGMQKVMRFW